MLATLIHLLRTGTKMVLLAQQPKEIRAPKEAVEIIMTRSCFGFVVAQSSIKHLEFGTRQTVPGDSARDLVRMNSSAYYVHAADDPSPDQRDTLTVERRQSIECQVKLNQEREALRAEDEAFARASRRALIAQHGV